MDDKRRLELLLLILRMRMKEIGIGRFLLDVQFMGQVFKVPTEEIIELCADVAAVRPASVAEILPPWVPQNPKAQLSLLKDGEMRTLADIEAEAIDFAIEHYHGQLSEVARRLGIGRSTLYRKLEAREVALEAIEAAADASVSTDG